MIESAAMVPRSGRTRRTSIQGIVSGSAALAVALALAGCRAQSTPAFDEARAFEDLRAQVAFGPRSPGSEGHARCRDWLVERLRAAGATSVDIQEFPDTVGGTAYRLSNVRARFGPAGARWILLGAHWDTRPWADRDPDSTKHKLPVLGANDGASGVAVLLEAARQFGRRPPPVGVEIVFFDGEDLGQGSDVSGFCRGSRYYVKQLEHPRPSVVVVLDMVGDKDLGIYYEQNSYNVAKNIVEHIWDGAAKVGATGFHAEPRHNVYDDHAPFIEAGIPGVDVIDFDYPAWHTTADSLDQVSAQSLGQVGRTVLWYVYGSEW
jgi:Zn-dependent M28 family amino/carboxypeptidase